jgi:hypothetical protein
MNNQIGQLISNHLKALGYEIKDESKGDECKFSATIADINPLLITVRGELVYIFVVYGYWRNEILDSPPSNNIFPQSNHFHSFIHQANHSSDFAKWYPQKVGGGRNVVLTITTCFFGYEKESFEKIIASFTDDIKKHIPNALAFELYREVDNG